MRTTTQFIGENGAVYRKNDIPGYLREQGIPEEAIGFISRCLGNDEKIKKLENHINELEESIDEWEQEFIQKENELEKLRKKFRWKPIETSPKELDTPFLAVVANNPRFPEVVLGFYNEARVFAYHEYPDDYNVYTAIPTHWMPLPELPEKESQK